jgi:LysR family transcriptional regulator, hypochlorite-specific transcription factor HypT
VPVPFRGRLPSQLHGLAHALATLFRVETKWLEDFVSLAETHSFSRSAQLRHVTQPAFSRRIQALEAWAGSELVDRSQYPTKLTPAGETFHAQALEILGALNTARNLMRTQRSGVKDLIEFAVPHTLAFSFFPHWLMDLRQRFGALKSRLIALNVHDAVLRLTEGSCDLLIAYHHASQPLQLAPDRYEMLSLGQETLAPYAKPDAQGQPMFALPTRLGGPGLPFLAYASGAYLARLVDLIVKQAPAPPLLDAVYETDMAEGLKAMALEGHGLAFLPASSVRKELKAKRLVAAAAPGRYCLTMEVRAYRERLDSAKHSKPAALALWAFLESQIQR